MKLISTHELARMNERDLSHLFRVMSLALAGTKRETPERRNTLASLENISRARAVLYGRRP